MVLQISTTQEHADVHIVDNSVDNQNAPPLHVVVEPLEISMNLGASNGSGRWSSTMELVGGGGPGARNVKGACTSDKPRGVAITPP
ncbi:hypothetical protein BALAC2494_02080 [Bifidobacterium animalis subsp. lactis CNCM I-2494]|uniref:Uncharacterized protein n=1 Tax=Bifidobacterium animalis subsp. lactis CNCM I-2494 TaxID=1042403 RepID=A0A806FVF9_BIFAN|nr:hypothetical protein BALAC2494_02080 [Bifidobacterium animalis subsp. lactis CNCM I-2494]